MFASRLVPAGAVLLALLLVALGAARSTSGAAPETRYVVAPGDSLWAIATAHYGGDPREGVWRIRERNGLRSATIAPGQVLVVP